MTEPLPTLAVKYTAGDQLPSLIGQLKESDFIGASVTLKVQRPTTLLTKTASVSAGSFTIDWAVDDLVAGVGQIALLQATVGGKTLTLARFIIDILAAPT